MGKGGIYGKRKKQDRPRSFKEETESGEGGTGKKQTSESVSRYGSYTINQGYDTVLNTIKRRRYERKRGKK